MISSLAPGGVRIGKPEGQQQRAWRQHYMTETVSAIFQGRIGSE